MVGFGTESVQRGPWREASLLFEANRRRTVTISAVIARHRDKLFPSRRFPFGSRRFESRMRALFRGEEWAFLPELGLGLVKS